MFETEKDGEKKTAQEQGGLVPRIGYGEDEDPIKETVILKVDMIDDEETGREQYRECGGMGEMSGSLWGILYISEASTLVYDYLDRRISRASIPVQGIRQNQLRSNHRCSLKVDRLPSVIVKVLDLEHARVDVLGDLGQEPFEVGKEGRVIEGPLRGILVAKISMMV